MAYFAYCTAVYLSHIYRYFPRDLGGGEGGVWEGRFNAQACLLTRLRFRYDHFQLVISLFPSPYLSTLHSNPMPEKFALEKDILNRTDTKG